MIRSFLSAIVVLACLAAPAAACDERVCAHAEHLPADVDVFIELRGADRGDWSFLSSLVGPAESADDSWRTLAGELGMDDDDAFRRLLGRRASLAIRGLKTDNLDWVALFSTDWKTSKLIRRKFEATPRRIVAGRPVLGLGGGRFVMLEIRHGDGVTLALAPAGEQAELFEAICQTPGERLAGQEQVQAFARFGEGARFFAGVRLPTGGWLSTGAETLGETIELTVVGQIPECDKPSAGFDPFAWRPLLEGSLFAAVERTGGLFRGEAALPFDAIPPMEPMLRAMGPEAGEVIALVLREPEAGGFEAGAAISTPGALERARELDAAAARSAALLSETTGEGAWEHDFLGLYPRALRTIRLSEALAVHWTYRGGDPAEAGEPGWLVAGNSTELVTAIAETASMKESPEPVLAAMAAWRSVGTARPAAIVEALAALGVEPPEALERLGLLSSLHWELRDMPEGRVDGRLELTRAK